MARLGGMRARGQNLLDYWMQIWGVEHPGKADPLYSGANADPKVDKLVKDCYASRKESTNDRGCPSDVNTRAEGGTYESETINSTRNNN